MDLYAVVRSERCRSVLDIPVFQLCLIQHSLSLTLLLDLHWLTLRDLIRAPVLFVAESQPAASVLREMRARRLHMAVVSDEFGGTGGLVTFNRQKK